MNQNAANEVAREMGRGALAFPATMGYKSTDNTTKVEFKQGKTVIPEVDTEL